ncbi:MAG: hypothetical protein ACPGSC_11745 [Granulosicoccaceae bacterium]
MSTFAAPSFSLSMFGINDLRDHNVLNNVMNALESDQKFEPQYWGFEERKRQPYDREAVIAEADKSNRQGYGTVYLWRTKTVKYFGYFDAQDQPFIKLGFNPKQSKKAIAAAFELANELVAAYQPDIATLSHDIRPDVSGMSPKEVISVLKFRPASCMAPVDFWELGPAGLAMHTWIGPWYLDQLGRDNVLKTPSVVCDEQDWGGIRLSLGQDREPWNHEYMDIIAHRDRAMKHLDPLEIFTVADFDPDRNYRSSGRKGKKSVLRSRYPLRDPPPPNPHND